MARDKNQLITLRIASPKETIFEGQVRSLSSINSKGKFDVLPYHANFLTLIENKPIILSLPDKKARTFTFPVAILYARENRIDVYTDIHV